ncbi:MAG TPA: TatD family deoxyribonuclease [Bacteroidetes bacterium]|nr:TatD family deoxyribonuclease [Bacteroidota bacterium]
MLINFHTHTPSKNEKVISVVSFEPYQFNLATVSQNSNQYATAGFHPWSIADGTPNYDELSKALMDCTTIGLGEVGLDKLKGPTLEVQIQVFKKQLNIANKLSKPVIVHCVKAWDEIIGIKKKHFGTKPWAIHGFNGNSQLAEQLLDTGFYLSVGAALLNKESKIRLALRKIPLNRLFLETDDRKISIEAVYNEATKLLNLNKKSIEVQLQDNFQDFFGITLH